MSRKIGYYFVELAYFPNDTDLIGRWDGEFWTIKSSVFADTKVTVLDESPIIHDPLPMNFWSRLEAFVSDVQTGCMAGEEEREMIMRVAKEKQNKI